MNILKKDKGFTIIEVVLVLAIAGLIFLMVFIALPALQRGQRDTARKSDVGSVSSAITSYTANNRGSFPTTLQLTGTATGVPDATGKFGGYVTSVSNNVTAITVIAATIGTTVKEGEIKVVQSSKCVSSSAANAAGVASQVLQSGTSRQFAVVTFLEAGGAGTSYCQDS